VGQLPELTRLHGDDEKDTAKIARAARIQPHQGIPYLWRRLPVGKRAVPKAKHVLLESSGQLPWVQPESAPLGPRRVLRLTPSGKTP
jgi:hypothetical protein